MSNRATTTIVLAVVLIVVVMAAAAIWTFSAPPAARYTATTLWEQPYLGTQSMKIIDLTGDGQNDLFVQNLTNVSVLDPQGQKIFGRDFQTPLATTLGDVNGDGGEEIAAFAPGESSPAVTLMRKGETVWTSAVRDTYGPTRVAVVRFASGTQVVTGDQRGTLVALSPDGQEVWRAQLGSHPEGIRGLDEALAGGQVFLAAANRDGSVALYDAQGQERWRYAYPGDLRRLRAYDLNGDRQGEILLGGEAGRLVVLDAASGQVRADVQLGQILTEIREGELDGDPSAREFVVGGKEGGVWALRGDGSTLWSGSLSDKVTEIAMLDVDDDGADETIVGDDSGSVVLFAGRTGARYDLPGHSAGIARLDAGKLSGSEQLAVADNASVQLNALAKQGAPFFYTPLVAGLIISLVIAIAAWFVATLPPKPTVQVAVESQGVESLEARRRMLHESLADVERLKAAGEMVPEAYLARLKELRGQLAETEAALVKAGVALKAETFKCPNCGGVLQLGTDKCDYCGQVVIT